MAGTRIYIYRKINMLLIFYLNFCVLVYLYFSFRVNPFVSLKLTKNNSQSVRIPFQETDKICAH